MAKNKECNLFRTSIGGQALIEGIMMRGIDKEAIVIRTPEGFIRKEQELKLIKGSGSGQTLFPSITHSFSA